MSDKVLAWFSVWNKVQMIAHGPASATATLSSIASLNAQWIYLSGASLP